MKVGILFDLDGTLLDTLEDLYDAVNYTLRHFGCPERTLEEVRCFVGNGAVNLLRRALPGNPGDPSPEEAFDVFRTYYNAHCQEMTRPYPGILQALAALQEFPTAIVSNKPEDAVVLLSRQYFGNMVALGDVPDCRRKPAVDNILRAMSTLGVDHCILVGDSEVDVLTAQNAGVPCLSVTWGFRDQKTLEQAGATHFCHDPAQLPAILNEMVGKLHVQ